jgi:hypothetical protein
LSQGKRVAIFCIGGHGRTGYFASLVLGKLGIDDPIAHIREKHCKKAVEDQSQVEHIADFLNRPEWKEQYKIFPKLYGYGYGDYGTSKIGRKELPKECCGKCDMWALNDGGIHMGYCFYLQKQAWDDDKPCIEFNPLNAIIKTSHEEVK